VTPRAATADPVTLGPTTRGPAARVTRALPVVAVVLVALVAPMVLSDQTFFVNMVLAAIVVTGLSLLMGYAGQASLGQGAFLAVGSLTVALLTTKTALPPLLALLCAPLLSAAFALVVGIPLLRLRGHYLAFGTLALLLIVTAAMSSIDLLGGPYGISGIPAFGVGGWQITTQRQYAYLALICLGVVLVVTRNLIHSRFGRGIRALASSESAAESAGVPVMQAKLGVFAVSAAYAGLAGAVGVFFTPFVNPDSFPPLTSFSYVVMAVIGGLGTLWGGVLGAVVISVLIQALTTLSSLPSMPPTGPSWWPRCCTCPVDWHPHWPASPQCSGQRARGAGREPACGGDPATSA